MFVPVIAGSDKTTVSVASGQQEYHPVYMSPGNLTNTTRRAHGNSFLPVVFLPIPKGIIWFVIPRKPNWHYPTANKKHRGNALFQQFCRQLYHACLTQVFTPLKPGMKTPEVVKCLDGHFHHAIYGIGPYITDYPEQVWLAAIVQGWCPKYAPFFFLVPLPITANLSDVMRIQTILMRKILGSDRTKRLNF